MPEARLARTREAYVVDKETGISIRLHFYEEPTTGVWYLPGTHTDARADAGETLGPDIFKEMK